MTDQEAIVHTRALIVVMGDLIGEDYYTALQKGIEALQERIDKEAKKKLKCGNCSHFCYGYGGLCSSVGHCDIRDPFYRDTRKPTTRACKKFEELPIYEEG